MSRAQRLTFLGIAAVIAIVAVVILLAAGGDGDDEQEAAATPTPSATASATPTPGGDETPTPTPTQEPEPEIPTLTGDGVTKLEFSEGDEIRFRVRADVTDHVHVHGYDLMEDVSPGKTVTFSFPATITGIFEIEFEDAHQQIGQLRVDPD